METLARPAIRDLIPYEPGKPIEEVKRELGLREVIKLASNENALGPSPRAVSAIQESASRVHLYPEGGGIELRRKIARKLGLEAENIILGNGSDEIIRMIVETFLNPGERVVVGDPAFIIYQLAARLMDGVCVRVPLKNFTHDLASMRKKINENTKLVFISNPNNPTGTMVEEREVREFMKDIPPHVLVIFDEAYYEYIEEPNFPDTLSLVQEGKRVVILRTFSKIYGLAGLRIGYGISLPEIIHALNRVRQPFNTNVLAQKAAIAALEDEEHLIRSREMVRKGKEYLYGELERLGLEYIPSVTNFILINTGIEGREIFERLLLRGVIVRPMEGYGLSSYIRVTVGKKEENRKFILALEEVLREVRE